ncbi:MAG TPA: HD domain-containing protein [Candidatus Polarisedimenticolaceae bacterium]|nr:HD domain-containing protein [Candidatus Polarisedimenticolaceae bacterium]
MHLPLDDDVLRVVRAIRATAAARDDAPPRALLVGGVVRDALLGRPVFDADLEVFGVPAAALERLLAAEFPGRVNTVGRSFGIFKVHRPGAADIDVSLPRTESKSGPGHRGFDVRGDPFLPFAEAARRRDFTVNALAYDPLTGELLDAHGGRGDLDARMLRAVDARTFPEDPLRVWRAFQLAARLGFTVEAGTFALLEDVVRSGALAELSPERVTDEIRKLLFAERPSAGWEPARATGALAATFPELDLLAATPQDPEWHPEGNVWTHTLLVVDAAAAIVRQNAWELEAPEPLHVLLGALLHDVGKATTTGRAEKDGRWRIVSPRHEAEGEAPARAVLSRLAFGEAAERAVAAIVRWHLSPGALYYGRERGEMDERAYTNAVRKVLKRIHPVRWQVLLAACEADWRGRGLPGIASLPFDPGTTFADAVTSENLDVEPAKPLVLGRDVLALGVAPGPEVGRLIALVEEARDRGEIRERDEALRLLERLVSPGE